MPVGARDAIDIGTGSGAISTGTVVMAAETRATATAVSATRTASSMVRWTAAAKPQAPPWITRTANPRSSLSEAPWRAPSRTRTSW